MFLFLLFWLTSRLTWYIYSLYIATRIEKKLRLWFELDCTHHYNKKGALSSESLSVQFGSASMIKSLLYLPFLPLVICKRVVCGPSREKKEEGKETEDKNTLSSTSTTSSIDSHTFEENQSDNNSGSGNHMMEDMPQSRFQSVRGIETKASRSPISSGTLRRRKIGGSSGGGGGGGGGGSVGGGSDGSVNWNGGARNSSAAFNNEDYEHVDRFRTKSDEYSNDEDEAYNESNFNSNFNFINQNQQTSNQIPASTPSSIASGFSRERVESINRAQHFIGRGDANKDTGELDRQTMERLLLADRTHAW
jgi:hypothetical protein